MQTIRHGVFETNSSSTHAICVSSSCDGLLDTLPVEDGKLVLQGQSFGWECADYNDANSKAVYLLLAAEGSYKRKEDCLDKVKQVIAEQVGIQPSAISVNTSSSYGDYLDHASDLEFEWTDENIRNFIFNPKSIVTTDNDNGGSHFRIPSGFQGQVFTKGN